MIMGCFDNGKKLVDPRMIEFTIGSVQYKALIDSGAMANTITPLVYEAIRKNCWYAIHNVILHPKEALTAYVRKTA